MRRTLLGIGAGMIVLLQLIGCAGPRNYVARVPKEQSELFVCAPRQLIASNYNIVDSSKEAGFIRASKQTTGGGAQVFLNITLFDELNISIASAPDGSSQMRVNAVTSREQYSGANSGAGGRTQEQPSETVIKDAESIIETCTGQSASSSLVVQ